MSPINMKRFSMLWIGLFLSVEAFGQVWINTNVASTTGPLPGASPVALSNNASVMYFPGTLKLMTNLFLHDDWDVPLSDRIAPLAGFTFSQDGFAAVVDIEGEFGADGRLGLYDGALADSYRLTMTNGTLFGWWRDSGRRTALWEDSASSTNLPVWRGTVSTTEEARLIAAVGIPEGVVVSNRVKTLASTNGYSIDFETGTFGEGWSVIVTNVTVTNVVENDPVWTSEKTNYVPRSESFVSQILGGGWWGEYGPSIPYVVSEWTNSWEFATNGTARFGFLVVTSEVDRTVFSSADPLDVRVPAFRLNGMEPLTSSEKQAIQYLVSAEYGGTNFFLNISGLNWGSGISEWQLENVVATNGTLVLATNSVMILTNTTERIMSEIRMSFTNESGVRTGEIGVYVNGEETGYLQPPMDGAEHAYALSTYVLPGDVLELRYGAYCPPSPVTNAAAPLIYLPTSALTNGISYANAISVWGLVDTNRYGQVFDTHGQILLVDTPTAASDERQAANRDYVDEADSAISAAVSAITPSAGGVSLEGNSVWFGNYFRMVEEGENLNVYFGGNAEPAWTVVGGGWVVPRVLGVSTDTNANTVSISAYGRTSGVYAVNWSTNLIDWARIETNAIVQTSSNLNAITLVFTNPAPSETFVGFSISSVVAPETEAKVRFVAKATTGTNDVELLTGVVVNGVTGTVSAGVSSLSIPAADGVLTNGWMEGGAILNPDASSNLVVTGAGFWYCVTNNLTPYTLGVSAAAPKYAYGLRILSTQACTLTNTIQLQGSWTITGTNIVVLAPCTAGTWRAYGRGL